MAGQQTWNKATAPAGSEAWGYVAQVKRALESAGLVFGVASAAERDGLAALAPGGVLPIPTTIFRTDLNLIQNWNGTTWVTRPHVEFTYATPAGAIPNGATWGPGALTLDTSANTTDSSIAAVSGSSDKIVVAKAGLYSVWFGGAFGAAVNGISWFQIKDSTDTTVFASAPASEFWGSVSIPNFRILNDNTVLWFRLKQTSGGSTNSAGRIRLTRIG